MQRRLSREAFVVFEAALIKPVSKEKQEIFLTGVQKKSALQKQKEAEEAKRKREEEEAARVLKDFTASFEVADAPAAAPKAWVKAANAQPQPAADADRIYRPQPAQQQQQQQQPTLDSFGRAIRSTDHADQSMPAVPAHPNSAESADSSSSASISETRAQKRRNMDAYFEELRRENESGAYLASIKRNKSVDDAVNKNDLTTNIFIGNMHMATTEMDLCLEFGPFGPIASVKVMKPRTVEEFERGYKWGFVQFMNRRDAAVALQALTGRELLGHVLTLDWGKSMPLPEKPIYGKPGPSDIVITIPTNEQTLMIIHRTIERVLNYGAHFESLLLLREEGNEEFSFLFNVKSPEHHYYRWRLYSLQQGDSFQKWRPDSFVMVEGGPRYFPPEPPFEDEIHPSDEDDSSSDDDVSDVDDEEEPIFYKGSLTEVQQKRLERILRTMTLDRTQIATAMIFCIEHADAADQVLSILLRSLSLPSTPLIPTKLGRLFLLSDLLYNSSATVPNAWKYRSNMQKRLPELFAHLGGLWKTISSRLKAEQIRKSIMAVVAAWESWMIFTPEFTESLRVVFTQADASTITTDSSAQDSNKRDDGSNIKSSVAQDDVDETSKFVKAKFAPIGFVDVPLKPDTKNAVADAAVSTAADTVVQQPAPPMLSKPTLFSLSAATSSKWKQIAADDSKAKPATNSDADVAITDSLPSSLSE
eukprot:jgi/Hompol1/4831/HPOL_001848-RA